MLGEITFICYILNSYDKRLLNMSIIISISNIYNIKLITEIIGKMIKINRSNISKLTYFFLICILH